MKKPRKNELTRLILCQIPKPNRVQCRNETWVSISVILLSKSKNVEETMKKRTEYAIFCQIGFNAEKRDLGEYLSDIRI